MKILLAIDGSTGSDAAVDEVARRPWPAGSEVKVVSAVEPVCMPGDEGWSVPPELYAEIEQAGHNRALVIVESALLKLRTGANRTLKLSSETPTGEPKQVILDVAEDWGTDLIMVGSHGCGAWTRFLLGSVSRAVALHARCSVEIVRRASE